MKTKLRKIVVNDTVFRYVMKEEVGGSNATKDYHFITTLRVFKDGCKNTPLEIIFKMKGGAPVGNPITANNDEGDFNLHKPRYVRVFIEEGIKAGWDWEKEGMKIQQGKELFAKLTSNFTKQL